MNLENIDSHTEETDWYADFLCEYCGYKVIIIMHKAFPTNAVKRICEKCKVERVFVCPLLRSN